ncbi:MAG TPA: hypothetical protein V6C52_01125 [Coleofasciculaceae cyanobacterium]|jgi:hypothetical protein
MIPILKPHQNAEFFGQKRRLTWLCLLGYLVLLLHPLIGHMVDFSAARSVESPQISTASGQNAHTPQAAFRQAGALSAECGLCHQAGTLHQGTSPIQLSSFIPAGPQLALYIADIRLRVLHPDIRHSRAPPAFI